MDVTIVYRLLIYCIFGNMFNVPPVDTLEATVRLRDGKSGTEGRVEVYHRGEWGTLCADHFDINAAYVVCRQLGFFSVRKVVDRGFGADHGPIHLNELKCTGLEDDVFNCEYVGDLNMECTHEQDAGVQCIREDTGVTGSSYKPIRLGYGGSEYEGRIEILHDGEWNTICDDKWDIKDARVACRQLGYHTALKSVSRAKFGHGDGAILFDDTACTGYEKYLNECPHGEYGKHDCSHGEDAGVVCDHLTKKSRHEQDYDTGLIDYVQPPMLSMSDSYIYSYDFQSDLEFELKSCTVDKCQNGATCFPLPNSTHVCICKYPWSGHDCEIAGPSIFPPPLEISNGDGEGGKWTDVFRDINTYIVFGGFSFLLILSIFIVYAIRDIRERRRELQQVKQPAYV